MIHSQLLPTPTKSLAGEKGIQSNIEVDKRCAKSHLVTDLFTVQRGNQASCFITLVETRKCTILFYYKREVHYYQLLPGFIRLKGPGGSMS